MDRKRLTVPKLVLIALLALGSGTFACGKDSTGPKLVTIRGIVRDIDTAQPAKGIRVSLYGTSYADDAPTGDDGAYAISVPRGVPLLLYAEDFDPATADEWFPLLNCDVPTLNVDQLSSAELDDWAIHCCPQSWRLPGRSVWLWDYFLQSIDNQDPRFDDYFNASLSATSGGVVAMLFGNCVEEDPWWEADSFTVVTDSPEFPVLQWRTFNPPDSTFYPPTRTYSNQALGIGVSIGDSSTTETEVRLTFTDLRSEPMQLSWAPFDCPVRKGMISLVWPVGSRGVAPVSVPAFLRCQGMIPGPSLIAKPAAHASR